MQRSTLAINGEPCTPERANGYALLRRAWQADDRITLDLPMPVVRLRAHPQVRHLAGKVALQRGPLVYCLEQADNGAALQALALPSDAALTTCAGKGPLAGMTLLTASGLRQHAETTVLYRFDGPAPRAEPVPLTFVPYFAWANRGEGEVRVWVDER